MKKCIATLLITSVLFAILPVAASAAKISDNPYYLDINKARYKAYQAAHPDLPVNAAIAYVNADIDKGFYNGIETVADPDSISVLVNKNFNLPLGYEPDDLVSIGGGYRLRAEAAAQLQKMKADMTALGYKIYVMSAYRTYQSQLNKYETGVKLYGVAVADSEYARPGHSEHQTGLAVDILQRSNVCDMEQAKFENSKEFAWLTENAYKYGFILRYPEEYLDIHGFIFEPWHWRYVGVGVATAMHDEGIALFEEYYGRHLAPGINASTPE